MNLPPLTQRGRIYTALVVLIGALMSFAARELPDFLAEATLIVAFVMTVVAAAVLAFWPRPQNPYH